MSEKVDSKTHAQTQEPGDGEAQAARALIDLRTAAHGATGICERLAQLLAATDPRTLEELRQLEVVTKNDLSL